MNTKGFRRMLFGEKMPDKNDPQYKERYERDVNAGRKFAQATRLDKLAAKIQGFANRNKILFLVMVFGFVIGTFTFNIYRADQGLSAWSGDKKCYRNAGQPAQRTPQGVGCSHC